jgi:hypothetical protein
MQERQLLMTQTNRDRLVALKKAKKRLITQGATAEELGVGVRQLNNRCRRVDGCFARPPVRLGGVLGELSLKASTTTGERFNH